MGKKEEIPDEFKGQGVFKAASSVIKALYLAYFLNAAVYTVGFMIYFGGWMKHPSFGPGSLFGIFRNIKAPIVYAYIGIQLKETYDHFMKILDLKDADVDTLTKAIASLTRGLNKIKMPLFIGAVMHLVQFYGDIMHPEGSS